jgi:hypothetical protein
MFEIVQRDHPASRSRTHRIKPQRRQDTKKSKGNSFDSRVRQGRHWRYLVPRQETLNERSPGAEARATKDCGEVHCKTWDGRPCPSSSGAGDPGSPEERGRGKILSRSHARERKREARIHQVAPALLPLALAGAFVSRWYIPLSRLTVGRAVPAVSPAKAGVQEKKTGSRLSPGRHLNSGSRRNAGTQYVTVLAQPRTKP